MKPGPQRSAAVLVVATIAGGLLLGFGRFLPVPAPPALASFLVDGATQNVFFGFLLVAGGSLLWLRLHPRHHGRPVVLAVGLYVALWSAQPLLLRATHRTLIAANDERPVAAFYSPMAGVVVERDARAGTVRFQTTGGLINGRTFLEYTARPRGVMEGPHRSHGPHWVEWWED